MKQENTATLTRYVETMTGFVPSLAKQALEVRPARPEVHEAIVAVRDAQKRLGAVLGELLDYEEGLP